MEYGEIEWPPYAVVTAHNATQLYWLTVQFVFAELFWRLME